ncbi:MAG: inactive serine/threonine-protein kinase VRK3 [Myxococcota bacterium]|jgi:serine/threonine protein kinase|nr:inactive serine/threonine-protein kinase VRK3 [Myxococcota bacterium]
MICPYCGAADDDREDRFCVACGSDLGPPEQSALHAKGPRASSAPTRLFRSCASCGERASERSVFCPACGQPFSGSGVISKHTRPAQATPAFTVDGGAVVSRGDMLWRRFQVDCVLRSDADRILVRARDLDGPEGTVAIELLHAVWRKDDAASERLRSRVSAVAGLDHTNLQRVIGVESDGQRIGVVKEWIPGATLAHHWYGRVGRAAALPPDAPAQLALVARFAEQLGEAIDVLHVAGVTHGAVHPGNVIVRPGTGKGAQRSRSRVVLAGLDGVSPPAGAGADWGDDAFRSYRAPELAGRGPETSPDADRFALGALSYRLMTGEEAGWPPRPPTQLVSSLPTSAANQVMAYLKHQPASRPRPAALLGQTLRSYDGTEQNELSASAPDGGMAPDAVTRPVAPAVTPEVASLAPPTFQPPAPDPVPGPPHHLARPNPAAGPGLAPRPKQPIDPDSIALQNGLIPGLGFHSLGETGLAAGTFAVAVIVWIVSLATAGWIVHVVAAIVGHNMAVQRLKEEAAARPPDGKP